MGQALLGAQEWTPGPSCGLDHGLGKKRDPTVPTQWLRSEL